MKILVPVFATLVLVSTCAIGQTLPEHSNRSTELLVLDQFVGEWNFEFEIGAASDEGSSALAGTALGKWSAGGNFMILNEQLSTGNRNERVFVLGYDKDAQRYQGYVLAQQYHAVVTGTWDEDAQTMKFKIEEHDGQSADLTYQFQSDDVIKISGKILDQNLVVVAEMNGQQTRQSKSDDLADSTATKNQIELRLAESEPGEGLTEVQLPNSQTKIYLHKQAVMNNEGIRSAEVILDSRNRPTLAVGFTVRGARQMEKITRENLGKHLAVIINGDVRSAPIIQSEISDSAMLTGDFDKDELAELAASINQ